MTDLDEMSPDLPKGWIWTEVGKISKLIRGVTYKRDQARDSFGPGLLPILRAGNIQERLILDEDLVFVDTQLVSTEQLVRAGDVILAMSSGSVNKVGKTAQAHTNWNGSFGAFCGLLRPKEEIDPRYFGAFFETRNYREKISNLAAGVNINNLRRQHLECLPIPLAPLIEQHRIVARIEELFSRLDAGVAALQKAKAQLWRYRQGVLTTAVDGRLTEEWRKEHPEVEPAEKILKRILYDNQAKWKMEELAKQISKGQRPKNDKWKQRYEEPASSDTEALMRLPGSWVWATVEQLASPEPRSIQSGPFGSALHHSEFQDSGVLAIGIDNVLEGRFSSGRQHRISLEKFEQLKKFSARPLDVLVTVMATVGRCCVVPADLEEAIITKHVYRISVNQSILNPYYLMNCIRGGSEIHRQISAKIRGQTRPGINGTILKQISIPVPPLIEQSKIVSEIECKLSIVDHIEDMANLDMKRINHLRQSILKCAFEGKLIPQDPNDDPANVLLEKILEKDQRKIELKPFKRANRRRTTMPKERLSLYEVLSEAGTQLAPEELFKKANFDEETVDDFYQELREEIKRLRIIENRPNEIEVYLKVVENENK